jgi:hypothetical protein
MSLFEAKPNIRHPQGDDVRFEGPFESALPVLDQEGRVTLNWHWDEITFGELIRSSEATALRGDPLRPYLILHYPAGNGLLADWTTLVNLWDLAWHVLERLAIAGGAMTAAVSAKKLVERVRDRTRRGRDAVAAHAPHWQEEQHLHPDMLGSFLRSTPRTTAQIAGLLGCSAEEATAVCWAFGLALDAQTQQWKPGSELDAQLLGGNTDLIIGGYSRYMLSDAFLQRIQTALEQGNVPPLPWGAEQEQVILDDDSAATID